MASSQVPLPPLVNAWESHAMDYQFPSQSDIAVDGANAVAPRSKWRKLEDPVIYPGLYSATGFDIMAVLLRIISRPNPQIELGAVDCSVSLVVCDLELPDNPIVYASDTFCQMTGYSRAEVLGRNCRFLQTPAGDQVSAPKLRSGANRSAVRLLRQAVAARSEIQLKLTNYKKTGQPFNNILSIIPIELHTSGYFYAVGFQVEVD